MSDRSATPIRGPEGAAGAQAAAPAGSPRLVLASASPRRQDLLRQAGYDFVVKPSAIDEDDYPPSLLPADLAKYLSAVKARDVASALPDDVVLGADTVVAFGDKPLGKPEDADEARRMIALLAGTTQIVITGVTLVWRARQIERTGCAMSAVIMRPLSAAEIDAYVAGEAWQGKAGGYGIQDRDPFVTHTAGSFSNVVGLPMELTSRMLKEFGILPAAPGKAGAS